MADPRLADPWRHRSAGMTCETCMWFAPKVRTVDLDVPPHGVPANVPSLGRCRRHAPTMNGYPVVFLHDWCGDHKLDENKTREDGPPRRGL